MKKLVLTAAMLLTLGLGVFAACTPSEEDPNPTPDPSEQTYDLGGYAETPWVSIYGTLNFEEGTYDGADSFAVTGVEGEYEDIVISCTMDGANYTLTYNNEEGRLDLYNAQGEFEYFFMADGSAFAGSWYTEDDTSAYYVISSIPDEEGYFAWSIYAAGSVIPSQTEQAITVFMFNEDAERSAGMFFYVPSMEVSYSFTSSGGVYMGTSESENGTAVTTYTGPYSSSYRNSSGDILTIDFSTGIVSYQGSTVSCSAGLGLLGSGIWFNLDGTDYALVYMGDATYLRSTAGDVVFAPYTQNWLMGSEEEEATWSDSNDLYHFEFLSETDVSLDGAQYTMSVGLEDGETVYRFAVGAQPYTIRPLAGTSDAFLLETDDPLYRGYYFRDTAMDSFMQTYSSNAQLLTISRDGRIAISVYDCASDTTTPHTAYFTYLEDLGAIAVAYTPYGTEGNTFYLTQVNAEGVYWAIAGGNGSYAVAATYLTEDFLPTAWETVSQALGEDSTYYTSGGAEPVTMQFDQERGTVLLSGEEYYFSWGYGSIRENASGVELYLVISNEPTDPTLTQYEYWRYTVIPGAYGLDVQYAEIAVDGANADYIDTPYWLFCAPESTMETLREIDFVYEGQYVQETVTFEEDGTLHISSIADGASDALLDAIVIETYNLTIGVSNNLETITVEYLLPDNTSGTLTIVDRTYLTIGTKVYAHSDLAAMAGSYYAADGGSLALTERAELYVDGSEVIVLRIDNDVAGQLTVTYRRGGADQTAVFTSAGATTNGIEYTKVDFTPEAFVGTYQVGKDTVVVSATADTVNGALSLSARINGILATPTLSYTDGNQTLTFSAFDAATMRTIRCTMTLDGTSLTVSIRNGGTSTATAADWSYADFAFEGEETVTGSDGSSYTLTCVMKGEAPVFLLDGEVCGSYVVTIAADGTQQLTVSCNGVTVTVPQA